MDAHTEGVPSRETDVFLEMLGARLSPGRDPARPNLRLVGCSFLPAGEPLLARRVV